MPGGRREALGSTASLPFPNARASCRGRPAGRGAEYPVRPDDHHGPDRYVDAVVEQPGDGVDEDGVDQADDQGPDARALDGPEPADDDGAEALDDERQREAGIDGNGRREQAAGEPGKQPADREYAEPDPGDIDAQRLGHHAVFSGRL